MAILDFILRTPAERRFGPRTSDLGHWREMYEWLEGVAGERITPQKAMGLAAYFACVRNIAEDTAKLPLDVYRKRGADRLPVDHPVDYLLNTAPNDDMTAIAFRETLTAHAAGMGNGYARIIFGREAKPEALLILDPTRVKPKRVNGQLYYEHRSGATTETLMANEVFHLHGLSNEGIVGYSIPALGRRVFAAALAEQKFVSAFFSNGAWPGGTLEHPGKLGPEAHKNLVDSLEKRHGGAAAAHKLMVLEEGMKYKVQGIAPENAQLLEQMMFHVEEVCRYFRMPPHKVQHLLRATFSNIEHQGLEYVGDCLMPWLVRWEQEGKRSLFSRTAEGPAFKKYDLFLKHNVTALLRADAAGRARFYSTMKQNAVLSVNEIRALEDMNSIGPEGDKHYHQSNMIELGKEPEPKSAPGPIPPTEPVPLASPEGEVTDDEAERARVLLLVAAQRTALTDAYARVLRVEEDKIERARKRGDLAEWSAEFYAGHGAHVAEVLGPMVQGLHATGGVFGLTLDDPEAVTVALAEQHVLRSLTDLESEAPPDRADGLGAEAAADAAIQYLCEHMRGNHVRATA